MSTFFALRLLVLESPLIASSHVLLGCVAIGSYWYRIAESCTDPTANIYHWDSDELHAQQWLRLATKTNLVQLGPVRRAREIQNRSRWTEPAEVKTSVTSGYRSEP